MKKTRRMITSSETALAEPSVARLDRFGPEQRSYALSVISACGGNLTKASARLGISIPTLSKWRRAAKTD